MKLAKIRRIKNKTNYKKRLILLKGNSPRLAVRKTNKYIILQIIKSENAQDKILYSATTKELLEKGWPESKKGSLKSLAASYLGGLMLGKKAAALKERIVLDTGLIPSTKGSRIYAVVKGIADAGMNIAYDKKVIPSKEKIEEQNKIGKDIFSKIKGAI